jgi:16S rRNA (cytosine1402-N4)-methyltransferase
MKKVFHVPVLLSEVAEYFITIRNGTYVDGTLGGGGHAEYILSRLTENAKYIAIDQDLDALQFAQNRLGRYKNVYFYHTNFRALESVLDQLHITKIDGLFLDLGVSSHQVDTTKRGFSYMQDTALDMRMDTSGTRSAKDLLNQLSEQDLSRIFFQFGEEKYARPIARQITRARRKEPINTTKQLKATIDRVVQSRYVIKSYARIFQALRIAINEELENLKVVLSLSTKYIKSGGRLVVISYHSLEDRIVKNFLKEKENPCKCPPELPECCCELKAEFKIITKKVLRPSQTEVQENPRSRSALMRVGQRL